MRASTLLFKLGVMLVCTIIFLPYFSGLASAAVTNADWVPTLTHDRMEIIKGESVTIGLNISLKLPTENYECLLQLSAVNTPSGISISPAVDEILYDGLGWRIVSVPVTITVDPDFDSTEQQRIDLQVYFAYRGGAAETGNYWKTISFYVDPVEVGEDWWLEYSPTYVSMAKNENETLYITIHNDTDQRLNFDINTQFLHLGFGLTATSGVVAINAGETREWTTTLTCTGYSLGSPMQNYGAVGWWVTNRESGTRRVAGQTTVHWIGTGAENVADLDIYWEDNNIEVPFGDSENVNLIIKNIGDQTSFFDESFMYVHWFANCPVWPYIHDPGYFSIAPGENKYIQFTFWAQGEPEEMTKQSGCDIEAYDDNGNTRTATIWMKAIVGTFSLKVRPVAISLQRGRSDYIYIHITNNENANRNYIIDSIELWVEMDPHWATSDPQTENVEITAFGSREIRFELTALGGEGTRYFEYKVRCDQTGKHARLLVDVEIQAPMIPTTPGLDGFLAMFAPFTGGDMVAAGYFVAIFMFIVPLTVVGLAISRGRPGLTVSIFGFTGIIMSTALGLIPSWIFIFILFVIALFLSQKGAIWGKGGG